jgi:hypothetical protein
VRIHKSRQHHLPGAIDLDDLFSIFLNPGIAERVLRLADRNNLPTKAKNGGIFEDGEFFQIGAASGRIATRGSQRQELANVDKQNGFGIRQGFPVRSTPTTETRSHGEARLS